MPQVKPNSLPTKGPAAESGSGPFLRLPIRGHSAVGLREWPFGVRKPFATEGTQKTEGWVKAGDRKRGIAGAGYSDEQCLSPQIPFLP
jgi:hypothetical protein